MNRFAETAEAIAGTKSRRAKIQTLSHYLSTLETGDLRAASIFFTGRPFPLFDARTLNIGGSALIRAIQHISGAGPESIDAAYMETADIGDVAEKLFPLQPAAALTPDQVFASFEEIAIRTGAAAKFAALTELLAKLTPREAKYVIKIVTGDLRIGLKENTVEEAIAMAFAKPVDMVRRANMSLGDIGETAVIAKNGAIGDTSIRLFRPLKFMLATPAESEDDIFANFNGPIFIEDKYDGIRGQLHIEPPRAAIYSRTLDEVSNQFPEIIRSGEQLAQHVNQSLVADGEIVALSGDRILPFAQLQKRLGRKNPSDALLAEAPVGLMIFDLLYLDGRTLIDLPLETRKAALQEIPWNGKLLPVPYLLLADRGPLGSLFEQSALRGNEGLMLKSAVSLYAPGKRGMGWMKWKKVLATLDVVVTAVEFGHGRRHNVLSDYTFAVQHDGQLLNIGKAYSGLTDREILEMTEFFKSHTIAEHGRFRVVDPVVVLEVAFNGIQKSSRHNSGFALRFPRILRIRHDKRAEDIDSLEAVEAIYERHSSPVLNR